MACLQQELSELPKLVTYGLRETPSLCVYHSFLLVANAGSVVVVFSKNRAGACIVMALVQMRFRV